VAEGKASRDLSTYPYFRLTGQGVQGVHPLSLRLSEHAINTKKGNLQGWRLCFAFFWDGALPRIDDLEPEAEGLELDDS
jgi:hypothetical protein